MTFLASAGGYLFCFVAGVVLSGVGCALFCIHKAAILKDAQDELAKLKAKF